MSEKRLATELTWGWQRLSVGEFESEPETELRVR
jgi:hypothetical protein